MAEPSSGRRVAFVARALLTTAFVLLLGACASQTTTYYPQKGDVRPHPYMLRCTLPAEQAEGGGCLELTIFRDGRAIVRGTTQPERARSVYAKYIGA